MILPDTNIWIAHFDRGEPELVARLALRDVLVHPFVIGELVLGRLHDRRAMQEGLARLDQTPVASHDMVMNVIDARQISGIGYVDAHLVSSALLVPNLKVWTRDKRLRNVADRLNILAPLS